MVDLTPPVDDQDNKLAADASPAAANATSATSQTSSNAGMDPSTVVETHFWRDVRRYLERRAEPNSPPADGPAMIAICPICQVTELDIAGLPAPGTTAVPNPLATTDEDHFAPLSVSSGAAVLMCGHMGCQACIHSWIRTCAIDMSQPLTCPACRASLNFTRCGHPIAPYHPESHNVVTSSGAQPDGGEDLGTDSAHDVPPTLNEGAEIPAHCRRCLMELGGPWLAAMVRIIGNEQDMDEEGRATWLERLSDQAVLYTLVEKGLAAMGWREPWTPTPT